MAVKTLQVTLTGAAQQILPTGEIEARWLAFQNNAAAVMRVGDANVSATRGFSLAATGGVFTPPAPSPALIRLSPWYVIGTATQLLDVIYDDGQ